MAKATYTTKLDWSEGDMSPDLEGEHKANYDAYKAAYRAMKAARVEFEEGMQVMAPEGKRLVFGYNFGKLSIATDEAKNAPKAKQGKQTLADFLAGQAGHQH